MKLLFVCYGNTCRSPMAAAIARGLLGEAAEIRSAGVNAVDGARPAWEAVEVMRERGLDITDHRARSVSRLDLAGFDTIVALDGATAEVLREEYGVAPEKLVRLCIVDPYGKGLIAYRECAREIESELLWLFGKG